MPVGSQIGRSSSTPDVIKERCHYLAPFIRLFWASRVTVALRKPPVRAETSNNHCTTDCALFIRQKT
jgi:hypothetical protein